MPDDRSMTMRPSSGRAGVTALEARVEAAVDQQRLGRNPAGFVAADVADHAEEIRGGAGSLHGELRYERLEMLGRDLTLRRLVVDRTGCHPVHGDPEGTQFER